MEQQENLEHPEISEETDTKAESITPCPQSSDEGSKLILGRYASVEHLMRAYEKLQAEFTRKAQRLAELETKLGEKHDNASVAIENLVKAEPKPTASESQQQIIQDYLASVAVKRQPPAVITASHDFAYMEKSGQRSIRDASHIAEEYFKSKGANYDNNPVS